MEPHPAERHGAWSRSATGFLLLALAPGFLNDLAFMRVGTVAEWLAADYASKILPLAIVLWHPDLRGAVSKAMKPPTSWWTAGAWMIGAVALALASTVLLKPWIADAFPRTELFFYPMIESGWLRAVDVTFGLGLTAVVEEILYRALVPGLLAAFGWRPWPIVVASAFAFGLIHWSHGIASVADAVVAGVLLMIVVRRTGSLLPAIGAHYAINLVLFA